VCFYRSRKKVRRELDAVEEELSVGQDNTMHAFGATQKDVVDLTGQDVLDLSEENLSPACPVETAGDFLPLPAVAGGAFLSNWVGIEHEILLRSTEPIYQNDFDSLRPRKWLTDGVINWYMHLLYISRRNPQCKMFPFTSFTYDMMRVERETNTLNAYKRYIRYAKGRVLSEFHFVFFPIHRDSPKHWCLVVCNPRNLNLAYYDPMGFQDVYSDTCLEILEGYLKARGQAIIAETRLNTDWTKRFVGCRTLPECIPRQEDGHSCGLFLCALADVLCAGGPRPPGSWGYSQADMEMLRKLFRRLMKTSPALNHQA
jgi:Ulp1 family protease